MIFTAKQREEFLTAAQPLMSWLAANCMEGICGGPSPSTPSQESPSREQLADDICLAITNYGEAEFAAGEWTADEERVDETAWCAEAADRIASLEAEVAALRGFIATYAYHWLYCMHSALEAKCTCGYDKALAAIDSAIAAKGK